MEPLTIFSLCMAVLNILLNTVKGLYDAGEQLINFEQRFDRWLNHLTNAHSNYILWEGRWKQDLDSKYEILFGVQGWHYIQGRRSDIETRLDNIMSHLRLNKGAPTTTGSSESPREGAELLETPPSTFRKLFNRMLRREVAALADLRERASHQPQTAAPGGDTTILSAPDIARWQRYLHEKQVAVSSGSKIRSPVPIKPDNTVMKRIIGLLYMNDQIERKIDEVTKAVDLLHQFSRNRYYKTGRGKLDADPQPKEVRTSLQDELFQRVATEIYDEYKLLQGRYQWQLELRLSDETVADHKEVSKAAAKGAMYFTVVYQPNTGSPVQLREISVKHLIGALQRQPSVQTLDAAMSSILQANPQTQTVMTQQGVNIEFRHSDNPKLWTRSLRCILNQCQSNKTLQTAFLYERARLAYSCTFWMILLWKTDWFANLCSCGFNYVVFDAASWSSPKDVTTPSTTILKPRNEIVFRTLGRQGSEHPCPRRFANSDKLYLLGILLAEIFICEPIELQQHGTRLEPSDTSRFKTNADIIWYLEQCDAIMKQSSVTAAVEFCFQNATEEAWRSSQTFITIEQIESLVDNVLNPVQKYLAQTKANLRPEWSRMVPAELQRLAQDLNQPDVNDHLPLTTIVTNKAQTSQTNLRPRATYTISARED